MKDAELQSRTSMRRVTAASIDISSEEAKVMALLPNAYMQGECGNEYVGS